MEKIIYADLKAGTSRFCFHQKTDINGKIDRAANR
jgi:hypothetical protein